MDAQEIQDIVLKALRGRANRIVVDTTYSVSDQPAEEGLKEHEKSTFYCEAVLSFDDFLDFRDYCNSSGVWITHVRKPLIGSDKSLYIIIASPKR